MHIISFVEENTTDHNNEEMFLDSDPEYQMWLDEKTKETKEYLENDSLFDREFV